MKLLVRPDFPIIPDKNRALLPGAQFDPKKAKPVTDPRRSEIGGAPVAMSSTVTIISKTNSVGIPFDSQTLQPAMRAPYWIDEIRIAVHATRDSNLNAGYFSGLGSAVQFQFWSGQFKFMKNPVPMSVLAPAWTQWESYESPGNGPTLTEISSTVRWPLPKPMLVLPGDVVNASVSIPNWYSFNSVAENKPVTVTVAYIGRMMVQGASLPKVRRVPWVSFFQAAGADGYTSTTDEFRNPFLGDLFVQRFTGRITMTNNGGAAQMQETGGLYQQANGLTDATSTNVYTTVRLYDSMGFAIVADYAPFGDVFDTSRKAWTFGRPLGPREQYDMQLNTVNKGSLDRTENYLAQVGMIGFREESV